MQSTNRELVNSPIVKLTHIRNSHILPQAERLSRATLEQIAYSQYHVAQAILAYKKTNSPIILLEGLTENLSLLELSRAKSDVAMFIFPEGLPDKFDQLNAHQKSYLALNGGAFTLYLLQQVSELYKTAESEEQKAILAAVDYSEPEKMFSKIYQADGKLKPEYNDLINEKREIAAIKFAKQAALETNNNDVLLVFGGAHNFGSRIEAMRDSSIVFKGNIETRLPYQSGAAMVSLALSFFANRASSHEIVINSCKIDPKTMLQFSSLLCCLTHLIYSVQARVSLTHLPQYRR